MAAGRAAAALVRSLGIRTKMAAPPPPHRLAAACGLGSSSSPTPLPPPPPPSSSGSAAGSSPQPPPLNMKAGAGTRFVDALFTSFNMSVAIWFIGGAFVRPELKALEDRIAALERSKTMEDLDAMKAVHRELERKVNEHGGPKAAKTSES